MSRPEVCLYCKGTGQGPGSPCGFCINGVPLDTQEDWDNSWGRVFKTLDSLKTKEDVEKYLGRTLKLTKEEGK